MVITLFNGCTPFFNAFNLKARWFAENWEKILRWMANKINMIKWDRIWPMTSLHFYFVISKLTGKQKHVCEFYSREMWEISLQ